MGGKWDMPVVQGHVLFISSGFIPSLSEEDKNSKFALFKETSRKAKIEILRV
jgi:hypothetical protein